MILRNVNSLLTGSSLSISERGPKFVYFLKDTLSMFLTTGEKSNRLVATHGT